MILLKNLLGMKRKYINSILACSMVVSLAACTDAWDEHYQPNPALNGSENLWELISNDSELDDFEALLQATGYAEVLKQNRSYTVWAPVNLSDVLDVKSLETANDSLLEVYRKEIVENHIADYSLVAGGIRDKEDKKNYKKVAMLNGKSYHFEGSAENAYSFAGQQLKSSNIVATNGVLHKIDEGVLFAANIWEQMAKEESISVLYNFLNKDTKREFNVNASVKGPIVDGKQTYLDSVFTVSNRWIDWGGIGRLNIEDSTYTVYALTDRAWDKLYTKMRSYYNYPDVKSKDELGSQSLSAIADSLVRESMCENLVFSNTVNKKFFEGKKDTLLSTRYNMFVNKSLTNREADSLHNGCLKELELSNGTLHLIDEVNFNPFTCWHDTIRVQGENLRDGENIAQGTANASESLYANTTFVSVDRDHALYGLVSGSGVSVFQPRYDPNKDKSRQPKFHIYAKDILSANYRISIVMVPAHLLDPEEVKSTKSNVFNAYLECINSEGEKVIKNLVQGKKYTPGEKMDTIVLAENLKIDFCEADYKTLTGKEPVTRLVIETPTTYTPRSNTTVYRIDQVMFEPVNRED